MLLQEQNGNHFLADNINGTQIEREHNLEVKKPTETSISQAVNIPYIIFGRHNVML